MQGRNTRSDLSKHRKQGIGGGSPRNTFFLSLPATKQLVRTNTRTLDAITYGIEKYMNKGSHYKHTNHIITVGEQSRIYFSCNVSKTDNFQMPCLHRHTVQEDMACTLPRIPLWYLKLTHFSASFAWQMQNIRIENI